MRFIWAPGNVCLASERNSGVRPSDCATMSRAAVDLPIQHEGMPMTSDTGLRVALVEDHPLMAVATTNKLNALGFPVTELATTAADAREMLTREQFDVAVVDYRLDDDADSLAIIADLSAQARQRCILYTSHLSSGERQQAASVGVSAVLLKHCSDEELTAALTAVTGQQQPKLDVGHHGAT